jgi:hypothetical protein
MLLLRAEIQSTRQMSEAINSPILFKYFYIMSNNNETCLVVSEQFVRAQLVQQKASCTRHLADKIET